MRNLILHAQLSNKLSFVQLDNNRLCIFLETPLTLAATSARPGPLLLALVGGGALIDYRARCGSTALHKAAEKNNLEAVRTLLDLGASANVKDTKGLTPLWNAISAKASPMLCQALLHDYSIVGVQDAQGWHEVHQVTFSFKDVNIDFKKFCMSFLFIILFRHAGMVLSSIWRTCSFMEPK